MKYSEMTDTELFILALDSAGYIDVEPSEESVKDCFMDYVDGGAWGNLFVENGTLFCDDYGQEEITARNMAVALIKLGWNVDFEVF